MTKYVDMAVTMSACSTQTAEIVTAVRKVGPSGSLTGFTVDGVARGKKMRNRRRLAGQQRFQEPRKSIHYCEA